MSISFTRFLVVETVAITALNAGSNAAYTFWLWRGWPQIAFSGAHGIATDLALTPIFIGFLSILLGTASIRRRLGVGKVSAPVTTGGITMAFSALTRNIVLRSVIMAVVCALLLAIPIAMVLAAAGDTALSLQQAVWAKVALTIGLSLLIVPIAALTAASDSKPRRAARAESGEKDNGVGVPPMNPPRSRFLLAPALVVQPKRSSM
ncbi:MAG: hypothetical protein ABI268_13085 [Rhodanobacter sp.]